MSTSFFENFWQGIEKVTLIRQLTDEDYFSLLEL